MVLGNIVRLVESRGTLTAYVESNDGVIVKSLYFAREGVLELSESGVVSKEKAYNLVALDDKSSVLDGVNRSIVFTSSIDELKEYKDILADFMRSYIQQDRGNTAWSFDITVPKTAICECCFGSAKIDDFIIDDYNKWLFDFVCDCGHKFTIHGYGDKYREAIKYILTATNGGEGIVSQINALVELVDKYEKLNKALDKICEFNDDNYVVFKERLIGGYDCDETLSYTQWRDWSLSDE